MTMKNIYAVLGGTLPAATRASVSQPGDRRLPNRPFHVTFTFDGGTRVRVMVPDNELAIALCTDPAKLPHICRAVRDVKDMNLEDKEARDELMSKLKMLSHLPTGPSLGEPEPAPPTPDPEVEENEG